MKTNCKFGLVCLLVVGETRGELPSDGHLPGFDEEAREYIRAQVGVKDRPDIFKWLMPFCSDLRPYARDYSHDRYAGLVRHSYARKAALLIRNEWLPSGWTEDSTALTNSLPVELFHGIVRSYWRVPNTIVPVTTWPSGAPVMFGAWEYRKNGAAFTILNSRRLNVVVVHRDGGFGIADPTPEKLVEVRDRYFRFPPGDLVLPEGWTSVFEIERQDARFTSGWMWSLVNGKRPARVSPNTWEYRSSFFFDGKNLAFVATKWSQGLAATFSTVSDPDIDWTDPQFNQ